MEEFLNISAKIMSLLIGLIVLSSLILFVVSTVRCRFYRKFVDFRDKLRLPSEFSEAELEYMKSHADEDADECLYRSEQNRLTATGLLIAAVLTETIVIIML